MNPYILAIELRQKIIHRSAVQRCGSIWRFITLLLAFVYAVPSHAAEGEEELDEVFFKVYVNQQAVGYTNTLIHNDKYYINIAQLMGTLGYPFEERLDELSFSSCCPNASSCFSIREKRIEAKEPMDDPESLIWYLDRQLYVESSLLSKLSSLDLSINYNSLAMVITTKAKIPLLTFHDIESKRSELILKGLNTPPPPNVDTVQLKNFRISSLGYMLNTQSELALTSTSNSNFGVQGALGLNAELFRGNFFVNYIASPNNQRNRNLVTFMWSLPLINKPWLKQVMVFRKPTSLLLNANQLSTGVYISNKKMGDLPMRSYLIKGKSQANTGIEVYKGNQLVSYLQSDSLGYYEGEIAIRRGLNVVNLVTYDLYGNPTTEEHQVYIPPNLEVKKHLGYQASVGVTDARETFMSTRFSYGFSYHLTADVGTELLYTRERTKFIPIFTTRFSPSPVFYTEATYIPNLKWSINGSMSPRHWLSVNYEYQRFQPNQDLVFGIILERIVLGVKTSFPFKGSRASIQGNIRRYSYPNGNIYNINTLANVSYKRISAGIELTSNSFNSVNLSNITYGVRAGYRFNNYLFTDFYALYLANSHTFRIMNRTQYSIGNQLRCFFMGDYVQNTLGLQVGVTWNLSSVQLQSLVTSSKYQTLINLGISGSAIFHSKGGISLSENFSPGASLLVAAFVDSNANGVHDEGERIENNIQVIVHTGHTVAYARKGIIFSNISSGFPFRFTVPQQALEDISWQLSPMDENILLLPNQSRTIHLPIHVISEVSGQVTSSSKKALSKVNRLRVVITNTQTGERHTARVDEWGFYSFMGLKCGTYSIELSPELLEKNQLKVSKPENSIRILEVKQAIEGKEFSGFDFVVDFV